MPAFLVLPNRSKLLSLECLEDKSLPTGVELGQYFLQDASCLVQQMGRLFQLALKFLAKHAEAVRPALQSVKIVRTGNEQVVASDGLCMIVNIL